MMINENDDPFHQWIRLEQPRLGSAVVYATDDFFADKSRLISPAEPIFIPDKYDDNGKWMDGWESRRKRTPGHDHCIVKLGVPGIVRGLDIDTRHFTGNFPPGASVEACQSDEVIPGNEANWLEIQPRTVLNGNSHHFLPIDCSRSFTHIRLHIYPDGGVARLRVYGEVTPDWTIRSSTELIDLLALENGGRALTCNDEHFGSMHNLNLPGRGINMGDGWETARRRVPGNDWVILALGHVGIVESIIVDTAHFKGNYPDSCCIQAARVDVSTLDAIKNDSVGWPDLLPRRKLNMDTEHEFAQEIIDLGPVSHVRLSIFPDGGISRLRVFGRISR